MNLDLLRHIYLPLADRSVGYPDYTVQTAVQNWPASVSIVI